MTDLRAKRAGMEACVDAVEALRKAYVARANADASHTKATLRASMRIDDGTMSQDHIEALTALHREMQATQTRVVSLECKTRSMVMAWLEGVAK